MMKKICFAVAILLFAGATTYAQNIRLNGYAGYVFDDRVEAFSGPAYFQGRINGGFRWGAGLEYMVRPTYGIELKYMRQDTKAPITYVNGIILVPRNTTIDGSFNWIMLGGNRYFRKPGGRAEGFFGIDMGAVVINGTADNGVSDQITRFGWGMKGGGILWATEKVGIKLQADLMSAVQGVGGGLFFGTGGAGVGVTTFSTMLQFGLGGGLTFALGDNDSKKK